jgi:hypothetical protein
MRALVVLLVAIPSIASADAWIDSGILRTETPMDGGRLVDGFVLRFAPRTNLSGPFYVGGELDGGQLGGEVTTPAVYRAQGITNATTELEGEQYAVRAVVGVRLRIGIVSGGGELAGGFHRAELHTPLGIELATIESTSTMVEGRARLDLWLTPRLTVGAVAGVELDEPRALSAGLMLGFHAADFDAMP